MRENRRNKERKREMRCTISNDKKNGNLQKKKKVHFIRK
jgi:hypothetical protein